MWFAEFRKTLVGMIKNKEYDVKEIDEYLRSHRNKVYTSPLDLHDDDGLSLIHLAVVYKRRDLPLCIMYMGWWDVLCDLKVACFLSISGCFYKLLFREVFYSLSYHGTQNLHEVTLSISS